MHDFVSVGMIRDMVKIELSVQFSVIVVELSDTPVRPLGAVGNFLNTVMSPKEQM